MAEFDSVDRRKAEAILAGKPKFVDLLRHVCQFRHNTGDSVFYCVEFFDTLYYSPSTEEIEEAVAEIYASMPYSWNEIWNIAAKILRWSCPTHYSKRYDGGF